MLNWLRSFAGSPIGAVIFAALIFALLFFGISGFGGSSMVANVGSQSITQAEFQVAYNQTLNRAQQQLGQYISPTRAAALQIPDSTLRDLIQSALLRETERKLGMSVSDEAVAAAIAREAYFQRDGQFSQAILNDYLAQVGQTTAQFLDSYREDMLRNQLVVAVRGLDPALPLVYQRILSEFYGEQRVIDYTVLTPDMLEPGREPTEEEVQAYYDANTDKWQVGETREVQILELSPRVLADPAAVTDEEVAAAYEEQRATAERRDVWQQVFATQADADAVQAALDAGQTFDQLLAAGTITPIDLGPVGRSTLFDPAVAEAAFTMEEGATQIVTGRSGRTLVHVATITAGDLPTLEEMAADLRQQIAESRTLDRLPQLTTQIDEARDSGRSLEEVAADLNIPIQTYVFDVNGNDPFGDAVADLPGGNAMVTNVFEADIGTSPSPVPLATVGAAAWYQVLDIIPPRQLALDEVHDRVVTEWKGEQDQQRLQDLAQTIAAMLSQNVPLDEIAVQLGVAFQQSEPLTRTSSPPESLTGGAVQAAFDGQLGDVTTAATTDGVGLAVQRVAQIMTPDFDPTAPPSEQVTTTIGDIADQGALAYIIDLEGNVKITFNMDLARQLAGVPAQ